MQHDIVRFLMGLPYIAGALGIFLAIGKGRKGEPNATAFAAISVGLFIVGLALNQLVKTQDQASPHGPPPIEVTETSFSSTDFPALSVKAPAGWRLHYEAEHGLVTLVKDHEGLFADTSLQLKSSLYDEVLELDQMSYELGEGMRAFGLLDDEEILDPVQGVVAGLPAIEQKVRYATGGSFCVWVVKRGKRFATTIQCMAREDRSACDTCRPIVDSIEWMRPYGVSDADL